jgi:hypothetical protein
MHSLTGMLARNLSIVRYKLLHFTENHPAPCPI